MILRHVTNDYWNHNTAYHPWIIENVARHGGDVLDVGCGDGLLLQDLAPVSATVTGIEPDRGSADRAVARLALTPNTTVLHTGFDGYQVTPASFDVVTFVAVLHHMDPYLALTKARELLRPGGDLMVVGIAANTTLLFARLGSALNRKQRDIGVPTSAPNHSLADIRQVASELLPGFHLRGGLYYRYLLRWTKPLPTV